RGRDGPVPGRDACVGLRAVFPEQVADRRPGEVAKQPLEPRLASIEADVVPEGGGPRETLEPRLARVDLPRMDVEDVRLRRLEGSPRPEPEERVRKEAEVAAPAPWESARPDPQARDTHLVEAWEGLAHWRPPVDAGQPPVAVGREGREERRVVREAELGEDRDRPVRDRERGRTVADDLRRDHLLEKRLRAHDVLARSDTRQLGEELVAVAVRRALVTRRRDALHEPGTSLGDP